MRNVDPLIFFISFFALYIVGLFTLEHGKNHQNPQTEFITLILNKWMTLSDWTPFCFLKTLHISSERLQFSKNVMLFGQLHLLEP